MDGESSKSTGAAAQAMQARRAISLVMAGMVTEGPFYVNHSRSKNSPFIGYKSVAETLLTNSAGKRGFLPCGTDKEGVGKRNVMRRPALSKEAAEDRLFEIFREMKELNQVGPDWVEKFEQLALEALALEFHYPFIRVKYERDLGIVKEGIYKLKILSRLEREKHVEPKSLGR